MDLPKLKDFQDMWWWIFLSVLISSVIVHGIVILASFFSLRKHKQGRWYFVSVAIMGIIMPLTGGIITMTTSAHPVSFQVLSLLEYIRLCHG
ncbi:unnamed protein product [Clavelina lepadiformis]|uniref:Uncharacterized protein n=1 Tax=Clavelina lepadiformis TaxID=159417 RepID=A0ABP0G2J2_CLALP